MEGNVIGDQIAIMEGKLKPSLIVDSDARRRLQNEIEYARCLKASRSKYQVSRLSRSHISDPPEDNGADEVEKATER